MNPSGDLIFSSGTLQRNDLSPILINGVQINERRIILDISDDSERGFEVFAKLVEVLLQFDKSNSLKETSPVVFTQETSCVATLDFDWTSLISQKFLDFGRNLESEFSTTIAKAGIIGLRSALVFAFTIEDQIIRENGVTLSPKGFVVEPRANVPLSERRYLTMSPTDTKTHLHLLGKLEHSLKSKR